jgi:putative transposase
MHRMPHAEPSDPRGSVCCFYKWVHRKPTPTEVRRSQLGADVQAAFEASKRTYGTPRIHADLVEAGCTVSENTVVDSMRRQGLQGRKPKRRKETTKQDKTAPKFSGSAETRLHRAGGACEVVWRHDRDPDR